MMEQMHQTKIGFKQAKITQLDFKCQINMLELYAQSNMHKFSKEVDINVLKERKQIEPT